MFLVGGISIGVRPWCGKRGALDGSVRLALQDLGCCVRRAKRLYCRLLSQACVCVFVTSFGERMVRARYAREDFRFWSIPPYSLPMVL